MSQHKTGRFLFATSECNYCSETNRYFYVFSEDGTVTEDYEGCGGYQGRNAKCRGESVPREQAVKHLNERLEELRTKDEELHEEIQAFEEFLDQHRKPDLSSLDHYDLEDLEEEILRRKVQTQEGVDELVVMGWHWREIDTFMNDASGIRQTGYYGYLFAPDTDLTLLVDLVLFVEENGRIKSEYLESHKKFSEWFNSLPKNKATYLYWHRI